MKRSSSFTSAILPPSRHLAVVAHSRRPTTLQPRLVANRLVDARTTPLHLSRDSSSSSQTPQRRCFLLRLLPLNACQPSGYSHASLQASHQPQIAPFTSSGDLAIATTTSASSAPPSAPVASAPACCTSTFAPLRIHDCLLRCRSSLTTTLPPTTSIPLGFSSPRLHRLSRIATLHRTPLHDGNLSYSTSASSSAQWAAIYDRCKRWNHTGISLISPWRTAGWRRRRIEPLGARRRRRSGCYPYPPVPRRATRPLEEPQAPDGGRDADAEVLASSPLV